jgi:uncharacterized protein (TIGR02996 family)
MTDGTALYRSILAHPADDTPRLVYADWLEENGRSEEAEFIRVECRLEAILPGEPEYTELIDRREELRLWLTAHVTWQKERLRAGLHVESGADWWNTTQRGFPRFLEFEALNRPGVKPIRDLAGALEKAFARVPTRWLAVRSVTPNQLAELLRHPVLAKLEHLTVQLDATDDPQDEACRLIADCQHLRNLRGLVLTFPVGDAGAASLASSDHLSGLKSLTLDLCGWCTPSAVRRLGSTAWFLGLESLNMAELSGAAFEELCRLDAFPNLHTLELHESAFPTSAWRVFSRSTAFPRLAKLVNRTEMADGQAEALAAATGFVPRILQLDACAIGNDGATALARAPWFGSLRRLDLGFNRLTASGFLAIAGSRKLTELKYLDLSYSSPGARGLRSLAANPALRGLTTLLLNGTFEDSRGLTPAHFHRFFTDLDMPALRRLELTRRPIGARAAKRLTLEKFSSLTRLGLDQCKLTDTAMNALVNAPALQNLIELDAAQNGLRTGVAALADRRVMPRLSAANYSANRIARDLARKLKRRPGIYA